MAKIVEVYLKLYSETPDQGEIMAELQKIFTNSRLILSSIKSVDVMEGLDLDLSYLRQ